MSKQFQLTEVEKLKLDNSTLRIQMMDMQKEQAIKDNTAIVDQFCQRVARKREDIVAIDNITGMVTFKEVSEPEAPQQQASAPEVKSEK